MECQTTDVEAERSTNRQSTQDDCCYPAVGLLRTGLRLYSLRNLGYLHKVRASGSFGIRGMVGIAIHADFAVNGSCVPRMGGHAGTSGMGASLTAFRFPAGPGLFDLLVRTGTRF